MSTKIARVSEHAHRTLKVLAEKSGRSMQEVLDAAVEAYRRQAFFDALDAGYTQLQRDPEAWQSHLAERAEWDVTLSDGVEKPRAKRQSRRRASGRSRAGSRS